MDPTPISKATRESWFQLGYTGDPLMDEKLLFYLQGTTSQISDVGEVLDTGMRITTHESWFEEWLKTADRVRADAEESLARGHEISAGKIFRRAANYYRAGLIHDDAKQPDKVAYAATSARDCFERSVQLLDLPITPLPVPYEGTTLPAYFVRSPHADELAPTIILHQGFDAWPEESWPLAGAIERGYHMLLLHGPGQGLARRLQGLPYRYDWEKVITPAVDTVLAQPGVDPDRIVLNGFSFGGYLAPRAAAFEHRLHTLIVNPGLVNFYESTTAHLPPALLDLVDTDPDSIEGIIEQMGPEAELVKFYAKEIPARFGHSTIAGWITALRDYDLGPVIDQIRCQTLIMDSDAELFMEGESKRLYDALTCPKDLMLFTEADTGQMHCQAGAGLVAETRYFDWLDEHVR